MLPSQPNLHKKRMIGLIYGQERKKTIKKKKNIWIISKNWKKWKKKCECNKSHFERKKKWNSNRVDGQMELREKSPEEGGQTGANAPPTHSISYEYY